MMEVRGWPAAAGPIDVHVERGDIVLVEGPNGAGKTSLLRCMAGLPAPSAPVAVELEGRAPQGYDAADLSARVAFVPQDPRDALIGLTVAGEFRLRRKKRPTTWPVAADRLVAHLSSGEARRLALALADAPLLLLDEPAEGLDPAGIELLVARIREHARDGAVVLTDHTGQLHALAHRRLQLAPAIIASAARPPVGSGDAIAIDPGMLPWTGAQVPSLRLAPGIHLIRGPNGVGKTTLLWCLAGVLKGPQARRAGAVLRPRQGLAMMPAPASSTWTGETVADELASAPDVDGLVPAALRGRSVWTLSGGEAQRVALARVLAQPADLLLLDEPEAHLDASARAILVHALSRRVAAGGVIIIASQDPMWRNLVRTTTELRSP